MKKIIMLLLFLSIPLVLIMGAITETTNAPYFFFRTITEADSNMAELGGADFGHKAPDPCAIHVSGYGNKGATTSVNCIEFIAYGDADDGNTATIKIWAYKKNGPAEKVAELAGTVGVLAVTVDPAGTTCDSNDLWFDTWVVTDTWIKDANSSDSGNDRIARVHFDLCGYEYIYPEASAMDMNSITIFWSYF